MSKPIDSKDVWGDDGDILKDVESMTNDEIAEKTKTLHNNTVNCKNVHSSQKISSLQKFPSLQKMFLK